MTRATATDLSIKMRALADSGHLRATELREKAEAFDRATAGAYAATPTHTVAQLFACWVRARGLYSDITGEPLI